MMRLLQQTIPSKLIQRAVAVAVLVLLGANLAGCAMLKRGGAPEPSFDVDKDLEELAKTYPPAESIEKFYKKKTVEARNEFVTGRLTMMNIRYIQFVRQMTSERQLLDSAADMLILGLTLAGASVGSAGTKTLLSALAAGVTGSKQIVDKNYYYEKTVPALVAQMNAERKTALVPIATGIRTLTLEEYPFEQAVTDLHAYYHAGTFMGALEAIQADAGAKERRKDEIIATLTPLTAEKVADKQKLTRAINTLVAADLPKIQAAIKELDPSVTPATDLAAAKEQLQSYVRGARTTERIGRVAAAFRTAGITISE